MRGLLTSSIGVTCAAALTLPALALTVPSAAAAPAERATTANDGPAGTTALAGSTRSLPLAPRTGGRLLGEAPEQGLYRDDLAHFSLVGVSWDNPGTELHGVVQVRTRSVATGRWTGWQDVDTHDADHGADPDTAEARSGRVHGGTAPLWVGESDGVDVRVRAEADDDPGPRGSTPTGGHDLLPAGLRLELVDPGEADPGEADPGAEAPPQAPQGPPAGVTYTEADASAAVNTDLAPFGATEIPALDQQDTEDELAVLTGVTRLKPHIGARPKIVTRRGWGADETLREKGFVYTGKVKAAFVHHTDSGNGYKCSQASSVIRSIYRYHVKTMGWRDIGYNFLVDKCGGIYEGRAGGVSKAVRGAHTLGFNNNSMGIAVLGTFDSHKPPAAAVTAIARLTAWKLGLFGANPKGKTYLKSGGGNLYPKGKNVRLNVISGHRDGYSTECPGAKLYARLGSARTSSARLQGR
ncbi:peptidoglycan recognition protein [Streptomyces sp. NPDC001068]|uniref:peptidoglycan recognition protein family protein n=1 Tax=Streptomyces sp. NPDC001068 TaxID=3364544 RepID=UPI0036A0DB9B